MKASYPRTTSFTYQAAPIEGTGGRRMVGESAIGRCYVAQQQALRVGRAESFGQRRLGYKVRLRL
jgi:hypothetical protein